MDRRRTGFLPKPISTISKIRATLGFIKKELFEVTGKQMILIISLDIPSHLGDSRQSITVCNLRIKPDLLSASGYSSISRFRKD